MFVQRQFITQPGFKYLVSCTSLVLALPARVPLPSMLEV